MKWLVLLALVGLASCRTVLVGRNNARDVTIQYQYEDHLGEEVDAEFEQDLLDLAILEQLSAALQETSAISSRTTPTLKAAPAPKAVPAAALTHNIVPVAAPTPTLKAAPAPKPTPIAPAVAPMVQVMSLPLTTSLQFLPVANYAFQPTFLQMTLAPAPQLNVLAPQPKAAAPIPAPLSAVAPALPRVSAAPAIPATVAAPVPSPVQSVLSTLVTDDDSTEDLDTDDEASSRTGATGVKPIPLARNTPVVAPATPQKPKTSPAVRPKAAPSAAPLAAVRKSLAVMDLPASKTININSEESDEN